MKKLYTLIFSQNNVNNEENYLLELTEIRKNESSVEKILDRMVFSPRKLVIDKIMEFAKESK